MKYKSRPIVETVDAVQWTGNNLREVIDLIGLHPSAKHLNWKQYEQLVKDFGFKIFLCDGMTVYANIRDMIVKDCMGYPHVYDPERFNRKYVVDKGIDWETITKALEVSSEEILLNKIKTETIEKALRKLLIYINPITASYRHQGKVTCSDKHLIDLCDYQLDAEKILKEYSNE